MDFFKHESKRKKLKRRLIRLGISILIALSLMPFIVEGMNGVLYGVIKDFGNFKFDFSYWNCVKLLMHDENRRVLALFIFVLLLLLYIYTSNSLKPKVKEEAMMEVSKGIYIPYPAGNGQYGTQRFMTRDELEEEYGVIVATGPRSLCEEDFPGGVGNVLDVRRVGNKEIILYNQKDVHTLLLGITGSGKDRRVLLISIWLNILAGDTLFLTDPKGDMYAYTHPFAEECGYESIVIDFRFPEKSMHYNYMQAILESLKKDDMNKAVDKTWDLVAALVGEPKGEKIWNDGECSAIAAAIMIVACDAPEACKNLTNVYYFIAYMCKPDPETGIAPITTYLEKLPDDHPAKGAFQVAEIAPYRTRASFFTSALATLRLFTSWNIAEMTSRSDFLLSDIANRKVIIYFIVPDESKKYYPLTSIFIDTMYQSLIETATKNGSLERRFEGKLNEFGNLPYIPSMMSMITAGRSRNIFWTLGIQNYQQLEKFYRDDFETIKDNAKITMTLKVKSDKTLSELSRQCGNYTIQVPGASLSQSDGRTTVNTNYNASSSLTTRNLLYPEDIGRIKKPDALILTGDDFPAITHLPDISKCYANKAFGMGSEKHNSKLISERNKKRKSRKIDRPVLWGIWNDYAFNMPETEPMEEDIWREAEANEDEKVSFL